MDVASVVFGALFLGIAVWWLVAQVTDVTASAVVIAWLVAGLLVVIGAIGVFGAIRSGRRGDE